MVTFPGNDCHGVASYVSGEHLVKAEVGYEDLGLRDKVQQLLNQCVGQEVQLHYCLFLCHKHDLRLDCHTGRRDCYAEVAVALDHLLQVGEDFVTWDTSGCVHAEVSHRCKQFSDLWGDVFVCGNEVHALADVRDL